VISIFRSERSHGQWFSDKLVAKRIRGASLDEDTALLRKTCYDVLGLDQRGRTGRLTFINGAKESEVGIVKNSRASWDHPLSLDVPCDMRTSSVPARNSELY
jgi:hypothetical protein